MATKNEPKPSPLLDAEFLKRSLAPVDIEERRRFEELYIRYGHTHEAVEAAEPIVDTEDHGGDFCYWTKVGANVVYYGGNVGVGVNPQNANDFEVFGNALIESNTETPYVEIRNWSDTARDPMIHWSVGTTPIKKFTMGVDDDDSNAWLLCAGDVLTSTVEPESLAMYRTYSNKIAITDADNNRVHIYTYSGDRLCSVGDGALGAGSGDNQFSYPWGICNDGTYVYIADQNNHRVVKRKIIDLSFVAKIGTLGTGNDEFDHLHGITTDGTYLYICDTDNNRIKKHRCSDLSYVSQTETMMAGTYVQ